VHPLWRNFRDYRKFCVPFARDVGFSLLTERELSWTLEKAIMAAGRRSYDTVPVLPRSKGTAVFVYLAKLRAAQINCQLESTKYACTISWVNDWHVSLVIRKWFSNSPDKYAGIVTHMFTSKYPFTRVNSLRMKHAIAARNITSSFLQRMVQLIVSQSCCSKFSKSLLFSNTTKFHPACPVLQSTWPRILGSGPDAFRSTSENSENLNRWFLLNGKRPRLRVVHFGL